MCFTNIKIAHSVYCLNHVIYFKILFESIPDYRKIVLLFLIKNDFDLLNECGFSKTDNNRLCKKLKKVLIKLNENYIVCIKNEEESVIENSPNK